MKVKKKEVDLDRKKRDKPSNIKERENMIQILLTTALIAWDKLSKFCILNFLIYLIHWNSRNRSKITSAIAITWIKYKINMFGTFDALEDKTKIVSLGEEYLKKSLMKWKYNRVVQISTSMMDQLAD